VKAPLCILPLLLVPLALAGSAQAASVSVENGTLRYAADPGERNQGGIRQSAGGDYELYDNNVTPRVGAGCRSGGSEPGYGTTCEGAGVQSISIALGDRDDDYCIVPALSAPLTLSGGAGRDTGLYCGLDRPAVALDNDDVADDGPNGRDNFLSDVERVLGTEHADRLGSGSRGAEISAGDGADTVTGGSGADRIFAAYVEDVGTESGTFYDQGTDTVSCGGGQDLVFADALDALATDCEASARPDGSGFLFSGSSGADFIVAPYGWSPARILTRRGRDRIETGAGGTNRIESGRGADTIRDGGISGNTVFAGPGDDVIVMRDDPNVRSTRDVVDCGKGRDRVYLDRTRDRAARDCERVIRR
jgi:hypothetical protein